MVCTTQACLATNSCNDGEERGPQGRWSNSGQYNRVSPPPLPVPATASRRRVANAGAGSVFKRTAEESISFAPSIPLLTIYLFR